MSDLISRQAVIDAIERNAYRHTYLDQIIDIVSELPSAQPEPVRHGKWIPYKAYLGKNKDSWVDEVRCSKCGYAFGEPEWKYCPECGSRMDGESDE